MKEILSILNNNSHLIQQIQIQSNDSQVFHLNSSTGVILSASRLDYEQKSVHFLTIFLQPFELHCSFVIRIQLININDQPIEFDRKSLTYSIDQIYPLPFYLGRIRLLSSDPFYSFQYRYYLMNTSSEIFVDSITGSIILLSNFNRDTHEDQLQYQIIVMNLVDQTNLTEMLTIDIEEFTVKQINQVCK